MAPHPPQQLVSPMTKIGNVGVVVRKAKKLYNKRKEKVVTAVVAALQLPLLLQ